MTFRITEKPSTKIAASDLHPAWRQIVVFDAETEEIHEHKLVNCDGEAGQFYPVLESFIRCWSRPR
jgi:hypothetical protein